MMHLGLFVKVSKLCNMRCAYCSEFPELGNKERMSLENIEKMFVHLHDHISCWQFKRPKLSFYWHGGEPFVQPIDYWENILQCQQNVFGPQFVRSSVVNAVQTNATLITEKHLPLLRNFGLGISYDVVNDLRVNVAGKSTGAAVEQKIDWLLSLGYSVSGIAVISRANVGRLQEVARFYLSRGIGFRALNIYMAMDSIPQVNACAASWDEAFEFFEKLYGLPEVKAAMARGIKVDPPSTARTHLNFYLKRQELIPATEQELSEAEWDWVINTDGGVYSLSDLYYPEFSYGNIFTQSLDELLASPGRRKRIERSRERLNDVCSHCFLYRRGCNGVYVSHASPEEARTFREWKSCYYGRLGKLMQEERVSVACT